jgi:hypothetical protein
MAAKVKGNRRASGAKVGLQCSMNEDAMNEGAMKQRMR